MKQYEMQFQIPLTTMLSMGPDNAEISLEEWIIHQVKSNDGVIKTIRRGHRVLGEEKNAAATCYLEFPDEERSKNFFHLVNEKTSPSMFIQNHDFLDKLVNPST